MIGVGLDFGTTNSSLAVAGPGGQVQLTRFPYSRGVTEAYRSLLYLEKLKQGARSIVRSWSGPAAIERYLEADDKGRLIQSLKSFLTSRTLQTTEVFGRQRTLEDLIAIILRDIRNQAELQFGRPLTEVTVGRPVRFVGAGEPGDDVFAQSRLTVALQAAGFEKVSFEFEPVGAAFHYALTLEQDELLMIGDFGGGTSDFSLIRVGPGIRRRGRSGEDLLGNDGVGVAGDSFDARIIRHLVSPALGDGSAIRSWGKVLPVPTWVFRRLERWHHLSLLRGKEIMDMLHSVRAQACEPERIQALLYLIEHDLGYRLHQAVQQVKIVLSSEQQAVFRFLDGDVYIEAPVTRAEFESWITEEIASIEHCVDRILAKAALHPREVDRVFLTGGSSFVPAVRRIFEARFGPERITYGDEFTSVARGLALRAMVV